MADEGPTTVGTILGKIKIDAANGFATMEAVEAKADRLAEKSPDLKITASAREAIVQMDAAAAASDKVTRAQARLSVAERQAANAASTAYIAHERLAAMQDKRGRTELQLAAATEAAARADRNAESAELRQLAAVEALNAAKQQAIAENMGQAASQERATRATDNAGKSMTRLQAILTAVVALGPGLIPIAAFAVGAGAALGTMAAVGILAILGIRNELKAGSADADEFAAGIGMMSGDMKQLEGIAARGVLNGFSTIVADLREAMPRLRNETSLYSRVLGGIASIGFGGGLAYFQSLQPLIIDVSAYLLLVTKRLAAFGASEGMKKFVTYAQQALPSVTGLLNSLVATAFHLLAAFAPWGSVVVSVITAVSNVINAIPTPVLSALIEMALGGSLAFKAWTAIPPMLMTVATTLGAVTVAEQGATVATGALGAAIDFMSGPVGWVVAGISALVAVIASSVSMTNMATEATNTYTAALTQDSGVIGQNVRLQAAKNLQDSGAIDNAKKLGISSKVLTEAVLGSAAAQKKITAAVEAHTVTLNDHLEAEAKSSKSSKSVLNSTLEAVAAQKNATITTKAQTTAVQDLGKSEQAQAAAKNDAAEKVKAAVAAEKAAINDQIKLYNDLAEATGGATISTESQYQAVQDLADRYNMSVSAYQIAKASQKQTEAQLAATTREMYLQNDAGGLLQQTLDKLNGKTITAAQAQNQFDSQIANMSDHMDAAGKQIDRANTLLTGNTAAAVANRGELINLTTAALANAQAYRNQTDEQGNLIHSSDETIAKMQEMKQQIIDNAVAHGEDKQAVTDFVNELYKIPTSVPAVKFDADTKAAMDKIAALKAAIAAVDSRLASGQFVSPQQGAAVAAAHNAVAKKADGGTVTGLGGPRQDNQITALSVGEEVTSATRASAYRPMLKAINNGTPAQIAAQASRLAPQMQPSGMTLNQKIYTMDSASAAHKAVALFTHTQQALGA